MILDNLSSNNITLLFGNQSDHVIDTKGHPIFVNQKKQTRFFMFLSLNNNKELTEKYIQSVEYILPKTTYANGRNNLHEYPFSISRVAYGQIEVQVAVKFQKACNLKKREFRFDHIIEVDKGTNIF
jgi:transcription initiation factor IIF auxiliary subunit